MKKAKYIIVIVFLIFFTNKNIYSQESTSLSSDKGIYVVLTEPYKYDNGYFVKIYLLNREEGNNSLKLVGDFISDMDLYTNYYQEYDFLNMSDAADNLYIIKYNKPWEFSKLKGFDVGLTFPFERDGNIYFGRMLRNYFVMLDINTQEKISYEIKEGNFAETILFEEIDNLGFNVTRERKLIVIPTGIVFPYQPPKEIIGDADTAAVFTNNKKYLAIQLNTYGEKRLVVRRVLCILNKMNDEWKSFVIKGIRNEAMAFPPYLVYRVGKTSAMWYSPVYTGEFIIVNYETGEMQEIFLEPPSDIYFSRDKSLIVRSENKLLHIPIIKGRIAINNAEILWAEKEGEEKIMKSLDGAFLGPVEVPKKVLLEKAENKNQIGERTYELSGYQRAADFFMLAIEYNPEYAQAYSNLGLAYYKLKRYDESIEYSQKAIELTENDTIKASSYYNIAMAYEAMEEWEKAMENYRKALEYRDHDAYREGIERMEEKIF